MQLVLHRSFQHFIQRHLLVVISCISANVVILPMGLGRGQLKNISILNCEIGNAKPAPMVEIVAAPNYGMKCMGNMVICVLVWKISKIEKLLFGRVSNKKHVLVESLIYKWANYQERNIPFGLVHIEDHWTIGRKKAVVTQQSVKLILGSIA